jgi:hypothetical protein
LVAALPRCASAVKFLFLARKFIAAMKLSSQLANNFEHCSTEAVRGINNRSSAIHPADVPPDKKPENNVVWQI